jgi:hypothetical protein
MERDYIMRLIEQIGALLASIIAKERAGQFAEARADINEKARQTIGLNVDEVRKLAPEAVAQLLSSCGGLRYGRAVILAELLLHDGEIAEKTGKRNDALLSYLHAFCLLSDTIETLTPEDQVVYRDKLKALAVRLENFPAHPYVTERIAALKKR